MCNANVKELCKNPDCQRCIERSFQSLEKSQYWSKKNELTPRQVFKNSAKKYIFDCHNCGHEFIKSLCNITSGKGWCSYCSNPPKKLCDNPVCNHCFKNSFASHPQSQNWSNKNKLEVRLVFRSTSKKYWFNCEECSHEYLQSTNAISAGKKCPFCSDQVQLCKKDDCKVCTEKSFQSHPLSKYWAKENKVAPRDVYKQTGKKYLFDCFTCGRQFSSAPHKISNGRWCPYCKNKTEEKLYQYLIKTYPNYTIIQQAKYEWCKKERYYPFDFEVKELKILVELDGNQHFHQIAQWTDPSIVQERDVYKIRQAIDNGYTIVHLLQNDVWKNRNDWKTKLNHIIEENPKRSCILIQNKNRYDNHIKALKEEKVEIIVN